METLQQKQVELSHLGEGNGQKINIIWTNLTDKIHRLDENLNSTQEKPLELTSRIHSHGHGNKDRIDQLTTKVTSFTNDLETLDQKVKTVQEGQTTMNSRKDAVDKRISQIEQNINYNTKFTLYY